MNINNEIRIEEISPDQSRLCVTTNLETSPGNWVKVNEFVLASGPTFLVEAYFNGDITWGTLYEAILKSA